MGFPTKKKRAADNPRKSRRRGKGEHLNKYAGKVGKKQKAKISAGSEGRDSFDNTGKIEIPNLRVINGSYPINGSIGLIRAINPIRTSWAVYEYPEMRRRDNKLLVFSSNNGSGVSDDFNFSYFFDFGKGISYSVDVKQRLIRIDDFKLLGKISDLKVQNPKISAYFHGPNPSADDILDYLKDMNYVLKS